MNISEHALEMIPDGAVVGLGSGRAATAFIEALGEKVRRGFRVRGIPTSEGSAALARKLGIPLTSFEEADAVDVDVDGADEVDPQLDLIKGLGGALVREKIVAAAAKRMIVLVGAEKLVPILGSHGVLPVEVVPFALPTVQRQLAALGFPPKLRLAQGSPFRSDNGNVILDCQVAPILNPPEFERIIRSIPGVVGTGLFLGMAHVVLVQDGQNMHIRERK